MARKAKIARELRVERIIKKYAVKRAELLSINPCLLPSLSISMISSASILWLIGTEFFLLIAMIDYRRIRKIKKS